MNDVALSGSRSAQSLALLLILGIVGTGLFIPHQAEAATYNFVQTSWTGGATSNNAVHPTNLTNWAQFATSTSVTAGANLQLSPSSAVLSARADVTQNWLKNAQNPAIAVATSTGTVYVVYLSHEYANGVWNIALRSSTNWSVRTDVTATTDSTMVPLQTPQIAVGQDGTVHIAYLSRDYNSGVDNISYRNSTNWSSRANVTTSAVSGVASPSIFVDASGVVYIAYQSNEYSSIRTNIAYRTSSNWTTRNDVTVSATANSKNPSIVVGADGRIHVAYASAEFQGTYANIAYRNSTNWATRYDVTATSTNTVSFQTPSLAVDGSGTAHVAYYSYEYNAGHSNIAYRNSANWAVRTDVTASATANAQYPSLAVGSNGTVHIVYNSTEYNAGSNNIAYRNSTNWTARTDVTASANISTAPSLALDGSDALHVAYISYEYNASAPNVVYRNSSNWTSRTDLTTGIVMDSISPAVAVATTTGITYVAYVSKEYNPNYYNVALRTSADWTARIDLTTVAGSQVPAQTPSIAVGPDGVVRVAYVSKEYNVTYTNVVMRTSTNWASPTYVTTGTYNATLPVIAVDPTNKTYVAYVSNEISGVPNIILRNSTDWTVRTNVSNQTGNFVNSAYPPAMAIDSAGTVHVIYVSKENDSMNDAFAYRTSANWATRTNIATEGWLPILPSIAVDGSGVVHLAYLSVEYDANATGYGGNDNVAYRNSLNWASRTDITKYDNYQGVGVPAVRPAISVTSGGVASVYFVGQSSIRVLMASSSNWASPVVIIGGSGVANGISSGPSVAASSPLTASIAYGSIEQISTVKNIAVKTYAQSGYASSGTLTSSKYDSGNAANLLSKIAWTATGTTSSASVKLQMRSASTSAALDTAAWCGFADSSAPCSGSNYFDDTQNGAAVGGTNPLRAGGDDEWFQYRVTLTSSGAATPTVTGVTATYVVNAPPEFDATYGTNGVTSSQITAQADPNRGKVSISYRVRDPDTTTGSATPGYVTPSFEYNVGGGWVAIQSQFLNATGTTNVAVAEGTYATYQATWDAAGQLGAVYAPSAQIRVMVNDNEAANNTTRATGPAFALDLVPPAAAAFHLDGSSASSTVTLTLTDDTGVADYTLSNNADFSADGSNAISGIQQSASSTSFAAALPWTLTGTTSQVVYLKAHDGAGNTLTTSATLPLNPSNFQYKDISSPDLGTYREFLAWGLYPSPAPAGATFASYDLYRSTDGVNYTLYDHEVNSANNYFIDNSVSSTTTYYYKVQYTTTQGNKTAFSSVVNDMPNGAGGIGGGAIPLITNVTVSDVKSTSAKITWTTDELSTSEVDYGLTTSYGSVTTVGSYVQSHVVYLNNLTPNTPYYFRVSSGDILAGTATSDNGGVGYTFTTSSGPAITNVTITEVSSNRATVFWNTNTASDSWVDYSLSSNLSNPTEVGSATLVATSSNGTYTHTVNVTGLTPAVQYYLQVKSTDGSGNTTIDTNNGSYYLLKTIVDTTPPVISSVASPIISSDSAVIVWQTDKLADSTVEYGTTASTTDGSYPFQTALNSTATISHVMTLSPQTLTLTGSANTLIKSTTYYYRVASTDRAGNRAVSAEYSFTTAQDVASAVSNFMNVGLAGGTTDTTLPVISSIAVTNITASGATISFSTDKATRALVEYGLAGAGLDANTGDTVWSSLHSITLKGLKMGTTYHFDISAVDKFGNVGVSGDQQFKTQMLSEDLGDIKQLSAQELQDKIDDLIESALPSLNPPFITKPEVTDVTEDSAVVTWKTNVKAFGAVQFAEEEDFAKEAKYTAEVSNTDSKLIEHRLEIINLKPNTAYHYAVKSYVFPQVPATTDDAVFLTKAPSVVVQLSDHKKDNFEVTWTTDRPTSSVVEYRISGTRDFSRQADNSLTTAHDIKVDHLIPGKSYDVRVFGYTGSGNMVEAKQQLTAFTVYDVTPPKIDSFRVQSALVPGRTDRTQTIISWETDKPASSVVHYQEGTGAADQPLANTEEDTTLTQKHAVIITSLKPGTVYRLQVESKDDSSNVTRMPMRTIITPKPSESIVDIIFKNLSDTFNFVNNLR